VIGKRVAFVHLVSQFSFMLFLITFSLPITNHFFYTFFRHLSFYLRQVAIFVVKFKSVIMGKALDIAATLSYNSVDDKDILLLIDTIRQGIKYALFISLAEKSPFSLNEWSGFLHISERTMQRYKKEKKSFDPIYSEKILEVTLLYKFGIEIFGNNEKFNVWLETPNLVLGGARPKDLLDNTFGISMVKDELTRIEYGLLA
jgi:putative toxin-antitoxin system antitoxin component (TIGR02293 family)